jgi:hypothetical protein
MRSLLIGMTLLAACAPVASNPSPPASRAAGFVEVSAGGPGDAALSRCLESPGGKPPVRLELEPHAAVDPADPGHLVAAWIVNAGPDTGAIAAAASFDGGRSWTPPRTLPVNACAGGPFDFLPRASDPWVAIGPAGRAWVSAVAYQPASGADTAGGVIVVASADGGRTWEAPAAASLSRTPEVYHDNTAVAADPRHPGMAYVLTTRYEEPAGGGRIGPATLAKTIDGGKTWSPARAISPRAPGSPPADAPQMVIDPRTGHLFVFYTHGPRGASLSFLRSEDGGESWSPPAPVVTGVPLSAAPTYPGTGKELRIGQDIAHAAIDPRTGRLYAVFTSGWATDGRSLEVGLVTSGDGGATWSAPLRVSATDPDTDPMAWRPALAIDARGRVAVSWFTPTPGEPVQGDRLPVSVHLAEIRLQPDGTLARGKDTLVDRFAWTPSPRGAYFLGDYNPLLAGRGGFLPLYGRSAKDGSRIVIVPAP